MDVDIPQQIELVTQAKAERCQSPQDMSTLGAARRWGLPVAVMSHSGFSGAPPASPAPPAAAAVTRFSCSGDCDSSPTCTAAKGSSSCAENQSYRGGQASVHSPATCCTPELQQEGIL